MKSKKFKIAALAVGVLILMLVSFAGGVAFGQDRLVEFATLGGDLFTELLERFRLRICRGSSML